MNKIAKDLVRIAKEIISDDYEYIYDPQHKKRPGGGYVKTDKGWSKGFQQKEEKSPVKKVNEEDIKNELRKKVEGMDWKQRKDMALSKEADSRVLDILADDKDEWVRKGVAYNKNTSTETLDKLSNDKDYDVRGGSCKKSKYQCRNISQIK